MEKSLEFFVLKTATSAQLLCEIFFQAVKSYFISSLAKTFNRRLRSLRTLLRWHCMNFLTLSFKEKEGELKPLKEEINKKREPLKN